MYVEILMLRIWFCLPIFYKKIGETSIHIEDSITVKNKLSFLKQEGLLTCYFNIIPNPGLQNVGGKHVFYVFKCKKEEEISLV